jgi:hypothetical protein
MIKMLKLLLALALLNILVFSWSAWTAQSVVAENISLTEAGVQTLRLLPETPGERFSSRTSNITSSCYSAGPFNTLKAAQLVGKRVSDYGLETTIRSIKSMETLNYFVYIPPVESRQAADDLVKDLKINGVEDYFIVTEGPYTNAISLGFYSSLGRASRYAEYIRYLGYDARYSEQKTPLEVYWLDYDEPFGSNTPVENWATRIDPTSSIQRIPRACN